MIDFTRPLLLEGDLAGSLSPLGPQDAQCPEQWLLQNPGFVLNVLGAFRDAGADILPAMTFGANVLRLADYELAHEHDRFNTRLTALAQAAAPSVCIGGGMAPDEHLPEPYGPWPYTDLIDTFAEQALTLARAGVEVLLLREMTSLTLARAAVMGARQARLPILVEMAVLEDGKTLLGTDPLASLLCLQELGISAFGLSGAGPESLLPMLRRIAPFARIPLVARPGMASLEPEHVSATCWELLASGARILGGGKGATAEHMQELRILLDEFDYDTFLPPRKSEDSALRLCDDKTAYFVDEDPVLSEPIRCGEEMAAAIAQAEAKGADVLLFHLDSYAGAYEFGQICHLCKKPVCLLAENAEALERGLVYYCGRALISTSSRVAPDVLAALAAGYGAILYDHNA